MTEQKSSKLAIDGAGRIYLKELCLKDVSSDYYSWMNDPEVTQYLEARFSDHTMEAIREFVANCTNDPNVIFLAIRVKEGDKHIGNIKLHKINRIHRTAEISIMIGDKNYWRKGYGQEAIRLLCDYAFHTLDLHKITAECYENNLGSLNVFRRAGFKEEGIRKKQYLYNNQYVDAYMLGYVRSG